MSADREKGGPYWIAAAFGIQHSFYFLTGLGRHKGLGGTCCSFYLWRNYVNRKKKRTDKTRSPFTSIEIARVFDRLEQTKFNGKTFWSMDCQLYVHLQRPVPEQQVFLLSDKTWTRKKEIRCIYTSVLIIKQHSLDCLLNFCCCCYMYQWIFWARCCVYKLLSALRVFELFSCVCVCVEIISCVPETVDLQRRNTSWHVHPPS